MILYQFDSFVLALLTLGNMRVGETISSVIYGLEANGRWLGRIMRPIIDTLFFFDQDHCYHAWVTYRQHTGQIR